MSKNTKSNDKWIKEIKASFYNILFYLNDNIKTINSSKIFAGLVVITLNIASRFVTIKISKTMESYLKFTFSRDVLVFCIVWMGSREIYVALVFTILFTFIMDSLLNEESSYCILPEKFTTYHTALLDGIPTEDEIKHAKHILEKASKI
jgi:hypothetical protein